MYLQSKKFIIFPIRAQWVLVVHIIFVVSTRFCLENNLLQQ